MIAELAWPVVALIAVLHCAALAWRVLLLRERREKQALADSYEQLRLLRLRLDNLESVWDLKDKEVGDIKTRVSKLEMVGLRRAV
jgi:hypothetical protein